MRSIRDGMLLCAAVLLGCALPARAQCIPGAMTSLYWMGPTSSRQSGVSADMALLSTGEMLVMIGDIYYGPGDFQLIGAGCVFLGIPNGSGGFNWTQEALLRPADAVVFDQCAYSTAIVASPGGDVLAIVGSNLDDHVGADAGSAAVFSRSGGGVWMQEDLLQAPDAAAGDQFGKACAIAADVALVGSAEDDDGGSSAGSAYVFARSPLGMTHEWSFQSKLNAPDPSASAKFGSAVAIVGEWAIVGAPFNDQAGSNAGAVYVFRRTPDGMGGFTWPIHSQLVAPDAQAGDQFGFSLAVDEGLLIAGAPFGGTGETGAAYIFRLEEVGEGGFNWVYETLVTPNAGQATSGDQCGFSVALSDGLALLGAPTDHDGGTDAGSAFLFRRSLNAAMPTWAQASKIRLPTPATTDDFGWSVALGGGWAAIGSPGHDQYGPTADRGNTFVLPAPAPPVILDPPTDQSIDTGDTLTLTATIAGRGPWTIQWFRGMTLLEDGGRISGATTDSLTIIDAESSDEGEFRLVATNDCGPSEASANVTVAPPPFCPGDANGDRIVNFADVTAVLANFGADYSPGTGPGDADGGGAVNFADVTAVLSNWGLGCP